MVSVDELVVEPSVVVVDDVDDVLVDELDDVVLAVEVGPGTGTGMLVEVVVVD